MKIKFKVIFWTKFAVKNSKNKTDTDLFFWVDLALEAHKRLGVDLDLIKPIPHEDCLYEPDNIKP